MIRLDGVSYWYPNAADPALADLSLEIGVGELVLVAGPSGSGKSTFLRCLNGLVPHFTGGRLSGSIRVDGLDPVALGPGRMSRTVGFVFQDPEAQIVVDRVEDEVAFALENVGMDRVAIGARVEPALQAMGIAHLRERATSTLSGGEKQRVAIAACLALGPRLIVLDEPTSQLDPEAAEDVVEALLRAREQLGLTVVLAEHRLERILPHCDRLVYLAGPDNPALSGPPRSVLREVDVGGPIPQLGRRLGWEPLPLSVDEAGALIDVSRHRGTPRLEPNGAVHRMLLDVRGLSVSFGDVPALRDVDLAAGRAEIVVVTGRNGSGKTTVLRAIVGLVGLDAGAIEIDGRSLVGRPTVEICRDVAYLPQLPDDLLFAETVAEELAVTLRNHDLLAAPPIAPDELLARLRLDGLAERYPRDLSVGQRQRVALGAVTVTRPSLLLLDEPTRGMDHTLKEELAVLLREWRDGGAAIVLVTHDVELAAAVADRVVVLDAGRVAAIGRPRDVLGRGPLATQIARLLPESGYLLVQDVVEATWKTHGSEPLKSTRLLS